MAFEIKMPQLSDTMNAGKILAWKKQVGDKIKRGDILAEVETEKANLEIESFFEGTLLKIMVAARDTAKVGEIIALIGAAGEDLNLNKAAFQQDIAAPSQTPQLSTSNNSKQINHSTTIQHIHSDRIKASPLARKIASSRNIDLSEVKGSGPQGRIVKKDLELINGTVGDKAESTALTSSKVPANLSPAPLAGSGQLSPFSKMRETIARRMQESVTQAPHFYVTTSINMREAVKLRETLKERPEFKGLSLNHLIIKAAAYALSMEPQVNYAVKEGQIFQPAQINIGVITAVEGGLLIPVIKDANLLALKDLVFEARAAVERARAGRPNSTDLLGGTFSISNMGMFEVENFTAIINPGQGAVLAVSSILEEPVVEANQILIGKRMRATLSVDHRIIDGVMAGTFQKYFKQALETPALLLV